MSLASGGVKIQSKQVRRRDLVAGLVFFSALLVHAGVAHAFALISNRGKIAYWNGNSATYKLHSNTSGNFSGGQDASGTVGDEFQPIRNAFNTWVGTGVSLSITDGGTTNASPSSSDGVNTVMWVQSNWRNLSFRPPGNALAVTLLSFDSGSGRISNADIYFNAETFNWAIVDSGSESGYVDIQNIATHETGHFLGLDHSSESIFEENPELEDATMYYASGPGEVMRRDLNDDDINGITNLYGNGSASQPSISSVDTIDSGSGLLSLRISGSNYNEYTHFVIVPGDDDIYDTVGRYMTVNSSGEVEVDFDVSDFPQERSRATLYAFNGPTVFSSKSIEVTGGLYAATSSGGGGGCQLDLQGSSRSLEMGMWIFVLLAALSLTLATRHCVKVPAKKSIKKNF